MTTQVTDNGRRTTDWQRRRNFGPWLASNSKKKWRTLKMKLC